MKFKSSVLFASRLLFPKSGKKTNARKSMTGAFLCIAISLIPLVMVLTVSNGMIEGITSRMIGLSSSHLCAVLHPDVKEAKTQEGLLRVSEKLRKTEGVLNSFAEIQSVGLAAGKKSRTGAQIRAVENDIFQRNSSFNTLFEIVESADGDNIKTAKDIILEDGKNAVIGKKLSELLNVHAGDEVRLITTTVLKSNNSTNGQNTQNTKIIPKITKFKVSAIISSGYQELDALWFFIPLKTGYEILPLKATQIMVGLETSDPFTYELEKTRNLIEQKVPNFTRVYKWNELNTSQYENFSSTQIMLLVIMLLIVLVASVNISSALVMLVMERRKEIAILKSFGATPAGITISFLITGMVTGGLGVAFGIPLGLLCAVNFDLIIKWIEEGINFITRLGYALGGMDVSMVREMHILDPAFYLQNIPLSIPLGQLVIIGTGTLVLSLLVSAIPAIKAGREKPIETLRKL